ncbi:MAG: HAD-IA family hydrolase [Halofilum sp. (in: g-proteobacteria)]|nr:HAD-IA family hydrolase [Halofilum sp. (in: g-proteobacteria)]
MDPDLKARLTARDKWLRLLYIVVYAIMFQVAEIVLGVTVVVHFVWTLFTGAPNANLRDFGQRLAEWLRQAVEYVTWASDARPWPFGNPWPPQSPERARGDGDSGPWRAFRPHGPLAPGPGARPAMAEPEPALQAVIFDVDGTLADTERHGHRVAYNQAFDELGADWEWGESFYGDLLQVEGGPERLTHYLEEYRPEFEPDEGRRAFVGTAHQRKNRHYQALLAAGEVPLRPGVRRLMDEVHGAGLRLAIASSSLRANVQALLTHALDPQAPAWFDVVVTGDDVARKKPDPEIYRRVLERLDLAAEDCIAIEDSQNGCQAAVAARLPTVVTTSTYTGHHAFDGAVLVADSLGEPGRPWHVVAGDGGGATHLDVAGLRRLHAAATAR